MARWIRVDDDDGAGLVSGTGQQEQCDPAHPGKAHHGDRRLSRMDEHRSRFPRSASGRSRSPRCGTGTAAGGAGAVERSQCRRKGGRALVYGRRHGDPRGSRQHDGRRPARHHAHLPDVANEARADARCRRGVGGGHGRRGGKRCARPFGRRFGDRGRRHWPPRWRTARGGGKPLRHRARSGRRERDALSREHLARPLERQGRNHADVRRAAAHGRL